MRADLRTRLVGDAAIAALVSDRVGWGMRLQGGALPAVTLTLISRLPDVAHSGATGLTADRVQADCYAAVREQAYDLAALVEARLSGWRGAVGATEFQGAFVQGVRDFPEEDATAPDRVWRVSIDVMIHHRSA